MTQTLATNATSYAAPADILARVDARLVGDLCGDLGVRITAAALATDANFLAAIKDACALVEMACFKGQRYLAADLALLAASTGVAQGTLFRLLARLTVACLYERRADLEMKQPWIYEQAKEDLERLAAGEQIFPFAQSALAGVPADLIETAQDVEARNGMVYQAARYFGRRGNRRLASGGS